MDDYRAIAHQKYIDKKKLEDEFYQKLKELEKMEQEQKEAEQQKAEQEAEEWQEQERLNRETVSNALHDWETIMYSFEKDILFSIHMLSSCIESTHILFRERNMIHEWQTRVLDLIERLNKIQEQRKSSAEDVKFIELAMKHLITLTGIDVKIETMDTTQDEDFALKIAQEEWQQDLKVDWPEDQWLPAQEVLAQEQEVLAQEYEPLFEHRHLPFVSLTKRGVGLNMVQLKELARRHGQKMSGTKEELSIRLQQAGWISIVE